MALFERSRVSGRYAHSKFPPFEWTGQQTSLTRCIAWMLLALVVWGWIAFLMLADYGPEFGTRAMCRGPLAGPSSEAVLCRSELRQWPALLGILALAVIATIIAAATTVYAKVLSRLARRNGPGVRPQR
ncbi:hypothetical protein ACFRU3_36585 [Streptomyces sp. NPDC056910]|uniref:hypothetical protein n=1 Tax=Streptomyces sp. NPDC056910 TaxID=3345964 RepID=UPI0036C0FB97